MDHVEKVENCHNPTKSINIDTSPCTGRSQRLYHVEAHPLKVIKNGEFRDTCPSYFTFQIANSKGADQTAWMCRLVCTFVVRKLFF